MSDDSNDDDDDQPCLCSTTLAALAEFYKERETRETELRHMSEESEQITSTPFDENWQLSQFWYDDRTIEVFVRVALSSTHETGKIALISCPTLYNKLKRECSKRKILLLEYDSRFKIFGEDFVQYDYKFPLDMPRDISGQFDLVIADPPFLSDECLAKTAITIKYLMKKNVVICTGAVMEELAERLLGVKRCNFIPSHKSNLANEFYCYANFDFDKALE